MVSSYRQVIRFLGVALALMLFAACSSELTQSPEEDVVLNNVNGNVPCELLGYDFGFKPSELEPPSDGTYTLTFPGDDETVTVTVTGSSFDWESTLPLDAVIVKGGQNGSNFYYYDPEATSGTGLVTPNNSNGTPADISHIEFCYDYEVSVSKTADTSYTRTYDWTIGKTADTTEATLAPGETVAVGYEVVVAVNGSVDADFAISGEVTVLNDTPYAASITSITDVLSDGTVVALECGTTLPYTLPAGESLVCGYEVAVPSATDLVNTATVVTDESIDGSVGGGVATAEATFGEPTELVDECVDVGDTLAGVLGEVCVGDAPQTFSYSLDIGPGAEAACDTTVTVDNTATFTTVDTGTTGSDSANVSVNVVCEPEEPGAGCTLTRGYWQTHSKYGPAPYDATWAEIGEDTAFFSSGSSYFEVLTTRPRGNAYYILAAQYIAAELNFLNGASSTDEVDAAFADATDLFSTYTPDDIAGMRGNSSVRSEFIALGDLLDDYNNGLVGPGHCE